jgi:hypothetical protein
MLRCIDGVAPHHVRAIVRAYPSPAQLIDALRATRRPRLRRGKRLARGATAAVRAALLGDVY